MPSSNGPPKPPRRFGRHRSLTPKQRDRWGIALAVAAILTLFLATWCWATLPAPANMISALLLFVGAVVKGYLAIKLRSY